MCESSSGLPWLCNQRNVDRGQGWFPVKKAKVWGADAGLCRHAPRRALAARVWRSANVVKDGKEATVCTLYQQSATRERKCASVKFELSRCSAPSADRTEAVKGSGGWMHVVAVEIGIARSATSCMLTGRAARIECSAQRICFGNRQSLFRLDHQGSASGR